MNPALPAGKAPPGKPTKRPKKLHEQFRFFAHAIAYGAGSPLAFALASTSIVVWLILGPRYRFSDTWQLVINTATSLITFLMVFLIQNTQNRDARAIHLKLDELIRAVQGARTRLVDLEEMSDDELEKMQLEFKRIHDALEKRRHKKEKEVGKPQINTDEHR